MSTQYAMFNGSSSLSAGTFFPTLQMLPAGMVDDLDDLPDGGAARLKSAERVLETSWHDPAIVPSGSAALPPVDAAEISVAERARRLRQTYRSGLLFILERFPALSHRERTGPLPRSAIPLPGAPAQRGRRRCLHTAVFAASTLGRGKPARQPRVREVGGCVAMAEVAGEDPLLSQM
jgi:hypothetical protein